MECLYGHTLVTNIRYDMHDTHGLVMVARGLTMVWGSAAQIAAEPEIGTVGQSGSENQCGVEEY
jgi:hypothetical protein